MRTRPKIFFIFVMGSALSTSSGAWVANSRAEADDKSFDERCEPRKADTFSGGFARSTAVAVVGGRRSIADIKVNDEVLAFDRKSGRFAARKVMEAFVFEQKKVCTLTLEDGTQVQMKPDHQIFYARDELAKNPLRLGAEMGAYSLGMLVSNFYGTRLINFMKATLCEVGAGFDSTQNYLRPRSYKDPIVQEVFNIRVEGDGNFFAEGVLVRGYLGR